MSGDGGKGIGSTSFGQNQIDAMTCPHCGAYTALKWTHYGIITESGLNLKWAECAACHEAFIQVGGELVYPTGLIGPVPGEDMSDNIREVYEEARAIAAPSPRAAAALLRVCVEMVVNELVPEKGTLFDKIGKLVDRGLDRHTQQMLDSVRIYGNDGGAHPGEIDLKEHPATVNMLMVCLNRIVEQMVTWPRESDELYRTTPENKRKVIEERDRKKTQQSPDG